MRLRGALRLIFLQFKLLNKIAERIYLKNRDIFDVLKYFFLFSFIIINVH